MHLAKLEIRSSCTHQLALVNVGHARDVPGPGGRTPDLNHSLVRHYKVFGPGGMVELTNPPGFGISAPEIPLSLACDLLFLSRLEQYLQAMSGGEFHHLVWPEELTISC